MKLQTSDRRRPSSLNAVAAELAAAVSVHVAFWLLLLSMLAVSVPAWCIAVLALLPVPLYFAARIRGFGTLLPVYTILLPVLAAVFGNRFFETGFRELFNYLAKAVNGVHGLALFPTQEGYPSSAVPGFSAQLALLLPAFLMAGLIAYAICRKTRPLALLVTILPVLPFLLAGLRPTRASFIFYLVAVTFYLILLTTRSKGTARRLTWLNGEISAALLVFLVLLALLLGGFERSEKVEQLQERVRTSVAAFRYAPKQETDGMPGGDLNRAEDLRYDGTTVLTVETPNAFSMYLRGFSGDVLEDGVWKPLPAEAYFNDYSLTGPWVRSKTFSPAVSLGQLMDLKWQVQTTQYERGERDTVSLPRYPVTIRNVNAYRDRVYLPYETSADSKGLRRADLSHEGVTAGGIRGQGSYELTVYQPQAKDYGSVSAKALIGDDAQYNEAYTDGFAPTEEVYAAFVKANETDVPERYREALGQIAPAALGSASTETDAVYRVRAYLKANYTYSQDLPDRTPGADPLLTFMTETKTGYCAHFASLAVLLFREAGWPARYAEGYYISKEMAEAVEQETDVLLEIPDSAAHAWVELYKEGVGWLPVEVTPGYYETESKSETNSTRPQEVPEEPEEVPEEPEQEDAKTPDEPEEEAKQRRTSPLAVLLPVLLLLLLLPLIGNAVLRRKIRAADSGETVLLGYRYLKRILKFWGIPLNENRPAETARFFDDRVDEYRTAFGLLYKETFSEEGLAPEERAAACDAILDLTGDYKQLRSARKRVKAEDENHTEANHG